MPKMPKDMMEMVFGNTFNTEGLDAKTRLLLTLAGLTMQRGAKRCRPAPNGAPPERGGARDQEIIETIGQMSMFAGLPAMTRAMQLAQRSWKIKRTQRNERNGFCILPVCTLHYCGGLFTVISRNPCIRCSG